MHVKLKQLLNSAIARYRDLSVARRSIICKYVPAFVDVLGSTSSSRNVPVAKDIQKTRTIAF